MTSVSSWCHCQGKRLIYKPAPDRFVLVEERGSAFIRAVAVREYCGECRGVLEPAPEVAARVIASEHTFEEKRLLARARAREGVGKALQGENAPPWTDVLTFHVAPRIMQHQLYDGWQKHRNQTHVIARDLRRFYGIVENGALRITTPIGTVLVDERLVQHPIDQAWPERLSMNHLDTAPFTIRTIMRPVEICESAEQPATETEPSYPPAFNFYGLYRLNEKVIAQRVIVHCDHLNAFTSFTVDHTKPRFARSRARQTLRYSWLAASTIKDAGQ